MSAFQLPATCMRAIALWLLSQAFLAQATFCSCLLPLSVSQSATQQHDKCVLQAASPGEASLVYKNISIAFRASHGELPGSGLQVLMTCLSYAQTEKTEMHAGVYSRWRLQEPSLDENP